MIQESLKIVTLDGCRLTMRRIISIVSQHCQISVSRKTWERLDEARQQVLSTKQRVYGLNTSVGQNKDVIIAKNVEEQFNDNLVKSHLISTGKTVPVAVSRIVVLIRINQLLEGYTGINPRIIKLMIDMYNRDVLPIFYSCGSVGEADIGILSSLAELVIGKGHAWYNGRLATTKTVFERLGFKRVHLGPKDALAILSSNAYGVGQLIYGVSRTERLLQKSLTILGLSMEGLDANVTPILSSVSVANQNPFQIRAAAQLRADLTGSYLFDHHHRSQVQDPISFRSATHIVGASRHAVANCIETINMYLAGSDDNPMLDVKTGEILSTGNFDVTDISLSAETIEQSLTHVSRSIFQRIKHLNNDQITGLPRFLIKQRGFQFGLQTLQKTAMDADVRIRQMAHPISSEFYGLAGDIEDHNSNLPLISEKLIDINDQLSTILSLELYNAAQAVYLRFNNQTIGNLGTKTQRLYHKVRHVIPPIVDDRPYNEEVNKVRRII